VILILAALWALVGIAALVWLVASGRLGGTGRRGPARVQSNAQAASDLDAEWIYGDRVERRPHARARESNDEAREEARREADAIVKDAELKAREIIAAAESARSRVEAELARERAQMAEKSKKLSEFLANALEEVERASANGRASAHDVEELEALREELRNTE
jgi:vacuolar-type H+-ATPase subunit H